MANFGSYVIPLIIGFVLIFGFIKQVSLFDSFIDGAKKGFKSCISILPTLVGLITAITMFKASGALDLFVKLISPAMSFLNIPVDLAPLMLLRPVSGSGALALCDNLFANAGVDSYIGRIAAVMMGSTETTFYAIAVYFGSVGVKKSRHTVLAATAADVTGYVVSVLTVGLFFCP